MSTVNFSSSNRTTFSINPLHDNGSNFADYELKVKVLCAAKGILKFLESWAQKPTELVVVNGIYMKVGSRTSLQLKRRSKVQRQRWTRMSRTRDSANTSYCHQSHHVDEPPHQICSYTLLFLLFLYFLCIIDPPLCTSAHDCTCTHFIRLISLIWQTHDLRFTCFYFYS